MIVNVRKDTCITSIHHVSFLHEHYLNPLQHGDAPLHRAASEGHTTYAERLLSTPGIDVNIKDGVSWPIECLKISLKCDMCIEPEKDVYIFFRN